MIAPAHAVFDWVRMRTAKGIPQAGTHQRRDGGAMTFNSSRYTIHGPMALGWDVTPTKRSGSPISDPPVSTHPRLVGMNSRLSPVRNHNPDFVIVTMRSRLAPGERHSR